MSSKLLPRDSVEDNQARPFVYRSLREVGITRDPRRPHELPAAVANESDGERERLQARVAELEQLLGAEVPAARGAGYREGEAAGRAQAEAITRPVVDRLCRSIQDLIEMKPRMRKELEEEAVRLALGVARRVLRRELNLDPSALQGLIQVAFERIGRQEITRLVVHPEQEASVRSALAQLTTRHIEIFADGGRETGTVIFETTSGALDASVDSQLREIELGLADRLKRR